jgi:Xaa-Pro dipeptidase
MGDERKLWFSLEEYQERLRKVRERMAEKDLDAMMSHTPENIYYLTGYQTPGYYAYQCFIVPAEGDPVMLTRLLEEPNARALSWVDERRTIMDTQDPVQRTMETLDEMGLAEKRLGVERDSWFLTSRNYFKLQELLPKADLIDCSSTVEKVRMIKSPQEIEYIRRGALAASEGTRQAVVAIAAGKTENDVAAAAYRGLILGGSEYMGLAPFIASGPRSALAHATWSGREMEKGDVVFLEMAGSFHRYHGALMRTVSVGKPTDDVKAKSDAVIAGLSAAVETIKPGVTSDQVDKACRGTIAKAGYGQYFTHRTGYSIGVAFPPDWGEGHIMSLKDGDQMVLREGMTFHMVPATLVYGQHGIGFSETVLVTGDGCEVLGDFQREMVIR